MSEQIDFKALAQNLLLRSRDLVPAWFPDGKLRGREWVVGNINGQKGDSLSINLDTGVWCDFAAPDIKGGNLISLYSAINNLSQLEAAKELAKRFGFQTVGAKQQQTTAPKTLNLETIKPPADTSIPDFVHSRYGRAVQTWSYLDFDGTILFYEARYETPDGKQIIPWSWSIEGRWIMHAWPAPRPLYGLEQLNQFPTKPILICEGPKTSDAARKLLGKYYVCVAWSGGANAVSKSDWSSIYGRKILIWADADEPGIRAARKIAEILMPHCLQVKVISTAGAIA